MALPYKPPYAFSVTIGENCARQMQTFADLAEKLKMPVEDRAPHGRKGKRSRSNWASAPVRPCEPSRMAVQRDRGLGSNLLNRGHGVGSKITNGTSTRTNKPIFHSLNIPPRSIFDPGPKTRHLRQRHLCIKLKKHLPRGLVAYTRHGAQTGAIENSNASAPMPHQPRLLERSGHDI
jgi:hypothetical protein